MEIPKEWTFEDAAVAGAFDDHVREQLPWYDMATKAVAHIARHFIPKEGLVYDIGASNGNIGRALEPVIRERKATLVGIESSAEMCALYNAPGEVKHDDALEYDYQDYDLAVCFLTFMFLPVKRRQKLLDILKQKINDGGALIIVDKCLPSKGYHAAVFWRLTLAGKLAAGANPASIIAKELSLSGVQRPLDPAILGPDASEWFRFGEFAGWLITR